MAQPFPTPEILETVTEAAESVQTGGIAALGLDVKAIIAQMINFTILLVLLRWLVYKPILNFLADRRQAIDESLQTAKRLEEESAVLENKQLKILQQAEARAYQIVVEAKQSAKQAHEQVITQTRSEQQRLIAKAKAEITNEKEQALNQARRQLAQLVKLATTRVLEEVVNEPVNNQIITRAIKEIR